MAKQKVSKKGANGSGTIRKKTVTRNEKQYTYWEARVTTGRDPGTGKQVQRSFTGQTQAEVRKKMQEAAVAVNQGTYIAPTKLTLSQWLDTWLKEFRGDVKLSSVQTYEVIVRRHIKPALGAVKLSDLHTHTIQTFLNGLTNLSPTTARSIYAVLHMALEKAVDLEYIPRNPADKCTRPKKAQAEITPLDDEQVKALLEAAKGGELEELITVALFSGMRLSELLGLTWDAIDFKSGTISVTKQLNRPERRAGDGVFTSPKNGKPRTITPAPAVMAALKQRRLRQSEMRLKAGPLWNNPHNLVFTLQDGSILEQGRVQRRFTDLHKAAGIENVRFHDLRHTYAVNAIRAGDDIKSIQVTLGHASAAFTLDKYGHFTERMKKDSAARMEDFMASVLGL